MAAILAGSVNTTWKYGTGSSSASRSASHSRAAAPWHFWTVPITTTVVGDGGIGAVLAARDMAAECRRAAALDRTHDLHLVEAHMAGIGATPCRPMVAEDIYCLLS